MNIENLNLVELNAQEVKEVEGGIFLLLTHPILLVFALGVYNGYQSHNH